MADLLDANRLRKLCDRATRTGSAQDGETFKLAAMVVVPELLAELDRLRARDAVVRAWIEEAKGRPELGVPGAAFVLEGDLDALAQRGDR